MIGRSTADRNDAAHHDLPRLVVALSTIALLLVAAVVVTGFVLASRIGSNGTAAGTQTGPLAVAAVPSPGADGQYCRQLMPTLPESVIEQPRRTISAAPPGIAAWGDPPVTLRCGITDPDELTCAASLTTFTAADGTAVTWLHLTGGSVGTYIAVDRPVRIAVTLPADAGVGPIQQLSDVIGRALPRRPVCTGGAVTPVDNG